MNEIIAEYLASHRRLVIPEFGAFVKKESGELLFSELLRTDDGVLTALLTSRGLNDMEVAVVVDRYIFEVRHELEQYGYCRLGALGTLRLEPATKTLRFYPPVEQSELPQQMHYVPQPDERRETKDESKRQDESRNSNATKTSTAHKLSKRPRKRFDMVMVVAVVILVAALAAIAYGWYVSNIATADDDAAIEELRVKPGQNVNE
ncbi:MAG: hypothetical protein E7147_02710 [Rikenellaceae bacterium]|nr:hypothetical protein [Rikenellaceae bacterium]